MKKSTAWFHELPLFAGAPDAWESLDEPTRRELLEHLARLLLAHPNAGARGPVPSQNPRTGGNTP